MARIVGGICAVRVKKYLSEAMVDSIFYSWWSKQERPSFDHEGGQ